MSTEGQTSGIAAEASVTDDPRIVQALEEYSAAVRAGRRPNRNEFVSKHADVADELRECLEALEFVHGVGPDVSPPADIEPTLEGTLGDYRIVREVGRGGMGVVYEAEQISLNRRVALKVLPYAATMDPRQLQRFRNEARAAASLRHEHIVHVYGVGCERGVHYYAMEFIEGMTLAQGLSQLRKPDQPDRCRMTNDEDDQGRDTGIREWTKPDSSFVIRYSSLVTGFSSYFHRAAELIAQAADALDYAHGLGIVHRDIKPSNLLLDERGKLWVTDFGLAKLGADTGGTMTGDLIGTLRYMSPEQALAKNGVVDHRTDIYALGATLYELLTLQPAVPGFDKQEVFRRIAFEEPVRPRSLDSRISQELETIVLKAMEKRPESRYGSAKDLADDLRQWLNDKPIRAKRPGLRARVAKWIRRNQGVSATIAISGLLLVLGTIAGLIVNNRLIRNEQTRTQTALEEAAAGRKRAREALDQMSSRIIDDWLSRQEKLTPQQKQFLEMALVRYEEFTHESGDTPENRLALAGAYYRVGDIRRRLGQSTEAESAFARSIEIYNGLVGDSATEPKYIAELADVYHQRAIVEVAQGRHHEALKSYEQARGLREQLVRDYGPEADFIRELANTTNNLAILHHRLRRFDEAIASYLEAGKLFEQLMTKNPENSKDAANLAKNLINRGSLFTQLGRMDEASASLTASRDFAASLANKYPAMSDYSFLFAAAQYLLADIQRQLSHYDDALTLLTAVQGRTQKLVREYPAIPEYRELLVRTYADIGLCQTNLGRIAEANKSCDQACALAEHLVGQSPEVPDYSARLSKSYVARGLALSKSGMHAEAQKSFELAHGLFEKLVDRHGDTPAYVADLADTCTHLGMLHMEQGRRDEARKYYESSRKLGEQLTRDYPTLAQYRVGLCGSYCNLGTILRESGDNEGALAWYARAIDTAGSVNQPASSTAQAELFHRNSHFGRAMALMNLARYGDAMSDWDRAIELDNGRDRYWLRLQRALCLARIEPTKAVIEAEEIIRENNKQAVLLFNAARVLAVSAARVADADLRESYCSRAMELLKRLHEQGLLNRAPRNNELKRNTEFDVLRQRDDFKRLLQELDGMNKNP
jgi:serine/threonine protein kinase/tetratricopeptide (TPR) repeat protein